MSKTTEWIKANWSQLTWGAGIASAIVFAAVQFWGGQFVDDKISEHIGDRHSHSVADIPVMQNEITHINESLDEIKTAQRANQREILNLLRSMPR